jgi:hypothetical protein
MPFEKDGRGVMSTWRSKWHGLVLMAAVTAPAVAGAAPAGPAETLLYLFTGGSDGAVPDDSVILGRGGVLYGTTSAGGETTGVCAFLNGCGVVFELTPPADGEAAWTETVLYAFGGGTDGAAPLSSVVLDADGALYGTTVYGGPPGTGPCSSPGCGVVFKLAPPAAGRTAWTETVLYGFKGGSDGALPQAGVILGPGGALYGTTTSGGDTLSSCGSGGCGTVFRLTPPAKGKTAWTETVLYAFKGGTDGTQPRANVILGPGGVLYGTTTSGGDTLGSCGSSGCGTVFRLTPPAKGKTAWTETVLHGFPGGKDGSGLVGGVILGPGGALYGTTSGGGRTTGICSLTACGVVFKLTPRGKAAWTETVLHRFTVKDGGYPQSSLVLDTGGALYGTTFNGGVRTGVCAPCGVVFKLTPPAAGKGAWTETVLHRFTGGSQDGANPQGGVILGADGVLYGTTTIGGDAANCSGYGCGVVFQFDTAAPVSRE